MANDRKDDGADPPATDAPAADAGDEPTDDISDAIQRATHAYLKDRFGLEETEDGMLEFPDRDSYKDLGGKAESFIQGFFKGFVAQGPQADDNPDLSVVEAVRASEAPSATERVAGLLGKMGDTLKDTFREYVAAHRSEAKTNEEGKTVVDGAFVLKHGAPLVGDAIRALGEAFGATDMDRPAPAADGADAARSGAGAAPGPTADTKDAVDIDYKVDFVDVLKALFVPKNPITVPVPTKGAPTTAAAEPGEKETPDGNG